MSFNFFLCEKQLIRIWSAKDLRTYAVITDNLFGTFILDMCFSLQVCNKYTNVDSKKCFLI
jgi:hypothetical protein